MFIAFIKYIQQRFLYSHRVQFMITVAVRTKTSINFSELNNKTLAHSAGSRKGGGGALDSSYFVKPDPTTHSFY